MGSRSDTGVSAQSVIFAGCLRNVEMHLKDVLANCERLSETMQKKFFVFAENDSTDNTRAILQDWRASRENVHVFCCDGLDIKMPHRTQRLAFLRNRILGLVIELGLSDYDMLCLMDFDEVNAGEIEPNDFHAATEFLFSRLNHAGVFAVSDPIYYDIWALRHPKWCPNDCWLEVGKALNKADAIKRVVMERQIPIYRDHAPIPVNSAFGGLGLYKTSFALKAVNAYIGLNKDGDETCEHVSFNEAIVKAGGNLYVFPALRNSTPPGYLVGNGQHKTIRLSGISGLGEIVLIAPPSHLLDQYLQAHPLYDRRLPLLLDTFNRIAGKVSLLDIGCNILDTIALIKLNGVSISRSISVDASLEFYKYAIFNAKNNPAYFDNCEILWGFVGAAEDCGNIAAENGTGSVRHMHHSHRCDDLNDLLAPQQVTFSDLAKTGVDVVKTDLDGYDQKALLQNMEWLLRFKPIIWAEANIDDADDVSAWGDILLRLTDEFPYVAVFDNFGFCVCVGLLAEKINVVLELIAIGARYRAYAGTHGAPRLYYVDIMLCPRRFESVFQAFIFRLPETAPLKRKATVDLSMSNPDIS